MKVAALFVQTGGVYFGLEDVEPWDKYRDARRYDGPWPVVAHPPCSRWCQLSGLVEARWSPRVDGALWLSEDLAGTRRRGEDGGCFAAALASVRRFGGVLEHPAFSHAWAAFGLPVPARAGGWTRDEHGGAACHVEQGMYGHAARKATWLYAVGVALPELRWGSAPEARALVSWCANHTRANDNRPRLGKHEASRTPLEFRELLLAMARSAHAQRKAA